MAVGISVVGLLTMRRGHISTQVVDERAVGWGLGDDIAQAAVCGNKNELVRIES